MKVLVLNGSPRGDSSITLQTVLYIRKQFAEDSFEVLNVGQRIKSFEKDFSTVSSALSSADVILFSYPVYTFIVPSQLHRFIELVKEHPEVNLRGKWATQISTSMHFYDTTAHKFIEQNCSDLGMKVVQGLSAEMEDLLSEQGQKDAVAFWNFFRFCCANISFKTPNFSVCSASSEREASPERPISSAREASPAHPASSAPDFAPSAQTDSAHFDTVIVTDCHPEELAAEVPSSRLVGMIRRFQQVYSNPTRVVNLREFHFNGGCLGCLKCTFTGKCAHKDGFDVFLREQIQNADATVYAFSIRDHSMGSLFKMFDDRQFCNGHRIVTMGHPVGYIVDGDLSVEDNLKTIIEARADVGRNFFAGAACTEVEIENLSRTIDYALQRKLLLPQTFYGVGGRKIFRDLIYVMRGMMKEDHRFYKKHRLYDDLPNRQTKKIITMQLLGALMRSPKIIASGKMDEGMMKPYKKLLEK